MSNTVGPICVIEDDALLGETIADRLRIEGLPFDWHRTGDSAQLGLARRKYSAVLCDLRLPDGSGKDIFDAMSAEGRPPFIFMTGFGTIDEAVTLLKSGADDFVTKPFDLDALMQRLHRLVGDADRVDTGPVLGLSPSMRKIETLIERLTESAEPVLISGESGVGKEVVSRLLHDQSQRPGEWVAVNCAALPEGLIEAELFGYTRGAFTGAARAHKGLIEQANGGTLFLDEVGDMPLGMQSRLLRVLQERRVTRIGAESATPVDFRLVCATHRDLPAMVHAGQFREDLYYRINVIAIHIPPLRQRREDILWLADKMLTELAGRASSSRKTLSLEAQQRLYAHPWPGNVRQLNHVLRRAIALGRQKTIGSSDLFQEDMSAITSASPASTATSLSDHLDRSERAYLVSVIQECDGAVGEAATRMGISRKTLWEKMKRHGIDRQHLERERVT
jgi:DNA-binding NtrC family response regulator